MPSWKKVVVSGSDATLNSLFVSTAVTASRFSGSFTGSLFGTASYVTGSVFNSNNLALSASYAISASYSVTSSNSLTASYVLNAVSSSFSTTSATASSADNFLVRSVLTVESASVDYQQNLSIQTGSWQTVVAFPTSSYRAAFFDYVMFSGSIGRAGIVTTFWSASTTEYYENFTEDLGGSTSGVSFQTAISASNIVLQATASSAAWTIRSLVRLL